MSVCGNLVAWEQFSWEAFATLVTGLSAVGAAFFIGRRQTEIHDRQVRLQELELRSEIFDRRYKVFESAEQFLREIIQTADDPTTTTQDEFTISMGQARFLFSPSVRGGLEELWKKWTEYHVLKAEMNRSYQAQGHYGDGNPERQKIALVWFNERFRTLPELFRELDLADSEPDI